MNNNITNPTNKSDGFLGVAISDLFSNDSSIGKSFTLIGFGSSRLVKRVKEEGLVLWSISQSKGHPDEFTHGWSGCDPEQLYFVENAEQSRNDDKQLPK